MLYKPATHNEMFSTYILKTILSHSTGTVFRQIIEAFSMYTSA